MFSRAIVGWKVSTRMNTDMVLDALEQALRDRGMPKNVIHHSDRGVQYLSIRYTNRLEAANYEHQSVQLVIHTIMLWLKQ